MDMRTVNTQGFVIGGNEASGSIADGEFID
jgi:hypothetical protein